jgi:hypothetical protein
VVSRRPDAPRRSDPGAGVEKDVTVVEEADPGTNNQIDAAYRSKLGRYSSQYVDPIVAAEARATTLKLVPR